MKFTAKITPVKFVEYITYNAEVTNCNQLREHRWAQDSHSSNQSSECKSLMLLTEHVANSIQCVLKWDVLSAFSKSL